MAVNNRYFRPGAKAFAAYATGGFMGGGTKTRQARSYSRTYTKTKRRARQSTSFSMKKYIRSVQPAKHCPFSDINITGGVHNAVYSFGPTQTIVRGTANDQRIGDAAHLLSLKINGFAISNPLINKATELRIMTLWSGEEYSCATFFTNSGLTAAEIMLTSSTPGWAPNGLVNPKAVTVLDDRVIQLNNSISAVADLESFNYTVPLNCDFDWQAAGSVFGKTRNLYVVVMGAVVDGITGTTVWGLMNISADLVFK